MRFRFVLLGLMLLVAACGGTATSTTQAAGDTEPTAAPVVTSAPGETTATTDSTASPSTESPDPTTQQATGPPAPEFTTTLSDGSQFELASHDRPVYLVFWAEW